MVTISNMRIINSFSGLKTEILVNKLERLYYRLLIENMKRLYQAFKINKHNSSNISDHVVMKY